MSVALTALLLLATTTGAMAQDTTIDGSSILDSDATYVRGPSNPAFTDLQTAVKDLVHAVVGLVRSSLWRASPDELVPQRKWTNYGPFVEFKSGEDVEGSIAVST